MSGRTNFTKILRFRLHTYLGKYPRILFPLYALFGIHRDQIVTPSTTLLIEGFPRSATTFCIYAFLSAQAAPATLALHLHVPAHVFRAHCLGVPILVLIRRPRDAVASAVLRTPDISIAAFLERYYVFYETLEPYRELFVLAAFEQATSDFGAVTERINAKYGTGFQPFEHNARNVAMVYAGLNERNRGLGGGAMTSYHPNEAKESAKGHVDFSAHAGALDRCEAIYERWIGAA